MFSRGQALGRATWGLDPGSVWFPGGTILAESVFDLKQLTHRWTVDGARSVFAELVTQCVRSLYPAAEQIRPNPGDEGLDTFVGRFSGKSLKIWQAKYFPDGIGDAQKKQIRDSFKSCLNAESYKGFKAWTLCIPIDMSTAETKWWQGWKQRQQREHGCLIELWSHSRFVGFYANDALKPVFELALDSNRQFADPESAVAALQAATHRPLEALPTSDFHSDANFVRKLEAADVREHRGARTAFYNFELLRTAVEQGGSATEKAELQDLMERLYDTWQGHFNNADELGKPFYTHVELDLAQKDNNYLKTTLPAHLIHKKGGLHHWADLCEAGWTENFRDAVGSDEDGD